MWATPRVRRSPPSCHPVEVDAVRLDLAAAVPDAYDPPMTPLVLTILGDDRSGLVRAIATEVTAHGGNWERSQMAELAGKFAGIVLVSIPDERVAAFTESMVPLQGLLEVTVQRATSRTDGDGMLQWTLEILGADRPGIVSEITTVLDHHGVNIDSLTTGTREAPMAAEMLFEAVAELEVPPTTDVAALRSDLEDLANELMVDLDLGATD